MGEKKADEMGKTDVSIVSIREEGDNVKMEKQTYGIDDLFKSLELNEFDTAIFAPREMEEIVNHKKQKITQGKRLKEKVRNALPTTEPDFIKGLIEEAAAKYRSFSPMSALSVSESESNKGERDPGWAEKVVIGYLTSIGAEELSKSSQTEYFEVPSGLDLVGIAAEGAPDEKATIAARKNLATLGFKDESFTVYRDVRIKSDKFGSLCGSDSRHLLLDGKEAGYCAFEHAVDGTGFFAGSIGEYGGKRSRKTHIVVAGDAGSGFMAESKEGHGTVDGSIKGSSAGADAEHLALYVKGNAGDMLLAESKHSLAMVGGAGSYAGYKAQKTLLVVDGKAGKLLGDGMVEGHIAVKELDTYQESGKLLGYSGTGTIRVPDEKSRELLAKENKPGYTIEVDGKFFAGKDGDGCESCSCKAGACGKE